MHRHSRWLVAAALFLLPAFPGFADVERWAVYYNNQATFQEFRPYDLLVLDSQYHPSLNPFISGGKTTLGYLSLGEVAKHHPYFADAQKAGFVLGENPNWPGSFFVDVRDPKWTKMVIEELIPSVLYQRFDGLFLDTLDNAIYLEQTDPEKYKGMANAAVNLVKAIRLNYPQVPLMMNRALALVPQVATEINMLLAESIYSDYNAKTKKYERVPDAQFKDYVKRLKALRPLNPALSIFTLDYWNPEDAATIKEIYRVEREQGFIPYVATIDLEKLVPEPS